MKISGIYAGGFYHDNKLAVREVLCINQGHNGTQTLQYRILSAKVAQEYNPTLKQMVSVIGSTVECNVSSFASWAKVCLTKQECKRLLLTLSARKIKLSPGEQAFMDAARTEVGGPIIAGLCISIDHTEGRAVSGLAKKGLVLRESKGSEAEFTELGAEWAAIQPPLMSMPDSE